MTCDLVEDIIHPLTDIRLASSMALATSLGEQPALASMVISTLLITYEEQNKVFSISNFQTFKNVLTNII